MMKILNLIEGYFIYIYKKLSKLWVLSLRQ